MKPSALILTVAVLGALAALVVGDSSPSAGPPLTLREQVRAFALGQVGLGDAQLYWDDVLPGVNVGKADWCGAFALWCLHQAGLATDRHWAIGSGFLLTHPALPQTASPKVGDIAYFAHNEHHAVVVGVTPSTVSLVNGNGQAGLVSTSTIHPSQATAFFSIEPLLAQVAA